MQKKCKVVSAENESPIRRNDLDDNPNSVSDIFVGAEIEYFQSNVRLLDWIVTR